MSISRSLDDLTPDLKALCVDLIERARFDGIRIKVICTLRTFDVQVAYYSRGRLPLKAVNYLYEQAGMGAITPAQNRSKVTWTLESKHLPDADGKSRAFDFVIIGQNGLEWNPKADTDHDGAVDWQELAEIGKALGLRCGYDWGDLGHMELPS